MNWAWWRKDIANPQLRHDELSPPSATLSPSASLAGTQPATTMPQRGPYSVADASQALATPPVPQSFNAAAPRANTVPNSDDLKIDLGDSALSQSAMPRSQSGTPESMIARSAPATPPGGKIPNSYDVSYAQQSSATMGAASAEAAMPQPMVPSVAPQRYSNPYVISGDNATPPIPAPKAPLTSPVSTDSPYAKTPFNAFAPKPTQAATPSGSPLRPIGPSGAPDVSINSEPVQTPVPPAAAAPVQVAAAGPATNPPASNTGSTGSQLPSELLSSSGGYAPGSIRQGTTSGSTPSVPTTGNAIAPSPPVSQQAPPWQLPATPSQSTTQSTSGSLGGGGSFKLGQ